jgi:multiple sugar transport system permease protein
MRLLYTGIYTTLLIGAIAMVYPFLLMLAGSTRSAVDLKELRIIPRFLYNDGVLYQKHIEGLFNESLFSMNACYDSDSRSFETVQPPAKVSDAYIEAWANFLQETRPPFYTYAAGYVQASVTKTIPSTLRLFKHWLNKNISPNINTVNDTLDSNFVGWNAVFLIPSNYLTRREMPQQNGYRQAFYRFKAQLPRGLCYYFSPRGLFIRLFLKTHYGRDIKDYNEAHETTYASYREIPLERRVPPKDRPTARQDWADFVRHTLNPLWLRADQSAAQSYQALLEAKYGTIDILNRNYHTDYASFDEIPLVEQPPFEGIRLSDWNAFLAGWQDPDTGILHEIPLEALRIHSLEFSFQDYLREQYQDIATLNRELDVSFPSFDQAYPPQRAFQYRWFLDNRRALRIEFITRNYRAVVDYMLFHGRAILNTAIYCSLAVLCALLVNPLAAYAMSRYRMPSTYKILLFLMATMAFPPMVTQIPVFLMLRRLHLLNTFAALVLPGLANGYSIFLLKGFFDSLPRELYESAQIDGAGEWTMFWKITMSLSKPILAVIALQAFTVAYANFMFALLICQDEKMWTMMVWLYQLQQRSGQAVVYASLIIAAIPTFIIFILCQNVIMRGIVVPVEQ